MKRKEKNIYLSRAIKAHREGDLTEARTLYEAAIIHEPYRPESLFNLGLVLIALKQMTQAAYCFEEVLKIDPDHIPAHYYLANCYFSIEKFADAQNHYEKVIDMDPSHVDALNNLGALLLHENNPEQAMQCFSAIIATHPDHLEARNNLAGALMQLQRYYHAAEHYRYILERTPNDVGVRQGYAMSLLDSGDFPEAIKQFEKVLGLKPDHVDAKSNMGVAYLKSGEIEKAEPLFEAVLKQTPSNSEVDYLYRAIAGKEPPEAPPSTYVKNLFDHYAKHYEQHVVDTLHYSVPQLLFELLEKRLGQLPDRQWSVFDLGCGTGLSGIAFRGLSQYLAGVDLSEKMLKVAKVKSIYDELLEMDLIEALEKHTRLYDLLLASDTFNYIGDFKKLFSAAKSALRSKGYLLFSIECSEKTTAWTLQANARYAHSKDYIENIALQSGFKILTIEKATLREQDKKPVMGWLCLLQA